MSDEKKTNKLNVGRLKKKNLKVWLPVMDEFRILARHISQSHFEELSDKCTASKPDPKDPRKTISERDEKLFREELAVAVVEEWDGIEDDDAPFPATRENLGYLMEECTEFRMTVMDVPLSLERMLAAERAANEKN